MHPLMYDRGRGPELRRTRITVYDLIPYQRAGTYTDEFLCDLWDITPEELAALRQHLLDHHDEVMAESDAIDERVRREWAAQDTPEARARSAESRRRLELLRVYLDAERERNGGVLPSDPDSIERRREGFGAVAGGPAGVDGRSRTVTGLLADINAIGHVDRLLYVLRSPDWRELWDQQAVTVESFPSLGLDPRTSDRVLYELCQARGLLLVTGNRNHAGPNALEAAIRAGGPDSLPVFTIADMHAILNDPHYAETAALHLLEYISDMRADPASYLGTGRLYLPKHLA